MRKLLLPLMIVTLFAGCESDDDPIAPQPGDHVGTYELVTISDEALPVEFSGNGVTWEVTAGEITLNADGTFQDALTFRYVRNGETIEEPQPATGVYTVTDGAIQLTYDVEEFSSIGGTVADGALAIGAAGSVYQYEMRSVAG